MFIKWVKIPQLSHDPFIKWVNCVNLFIIFYQKKKLRKNKKINIFNIKFRINE